MPTQKEVIETYWCPGRWPWQWFRTCRRTVTKWCYFFQQLKEVRWGLFCNLTGCENGIEYKWTAFCFNVFGTEVYYNIEKCFKELKSQSGTCQNIDFPPID